MASGRVTIIDERGFVHQRDATFDEQDGAEKWYFDTSGLDGTFTFIFTRLAKGDGRKEE